MTLTIQPPRIPFTDANHYVTREWYHYLLELQVRGGGYDALTNAELSAGAFEDAGIEEAKADMYRLRDDLMTAPRSELVAAVEHMETQLAELAAQMSVLQAQIQDLNQG